MSDWLAEATAEAVPIHAATAESLERVLGALPAEAAGFARASGFEAKAGTLALLPGGGRLAGVLFGLGKAGAGDGDRLLAGKLPGALPAGTYRLAGDWPEPQLAAIAFGLGAYRFARYRKDERKPVRLAAPEGADAAEIARIVAAAWATRDLVNTPASDLGPAELAAAARALAERHGAAFAETKGAALAEGFPMIATVGAAAAPGREPRLVDMSWGDPAHPKVTLVGKGVTFDTGGLDLKPSAAMLLMKKDMGGAANALGLAAMIMDAGLKLRLRLLLPIVENAVSGPAFRPGDVLRSRKGISVEIGNTDAEGRLILADALALASEEAPALLIDFATLTGAARVALGPELPGIFTADDGLAAELARHAAATADPSWRLPLWAPYFAMLDSKVADINNAGTGGLAGAITAALFLSRFVGEGIAWLHADLFAWNPGTRPGRPEGGEAQVIRSLYALLKARYG